MDNTNFAQGDATHLDFEEVKLIRTDDGKFMTEIEAKRLGLTGSTLLVLRFFMWRYFFDIWLVMPNHERNNNKEWRFECQKNLS